MARAKKESEVLSCKLEKEVSDKLTELSEETGLTKTKIVEKAIKEYYEKYKTTGRI